MPLPSSELSPQQRVQQTTARILQVFIFCDVFFLITSIILFFLASVSRDPPFNRSLLLNVSAVIGLYGSLSAICNCLASYGVNRWRRLFLLPYIIFIPMVMAMLFIILFRLVFTNGIRETIALPLVTCVVLAYIWLKLLKQWATMSKPLVIIPPQEDFESQTLALAAAMAMLHGLTPGGMSQEVETGRDPPPKYETLEVDVTDPPPPCYEEAIQGGEEFQQHSH